MKTKMTIVFLASIFFLSVAVLESLALRCGLGLVTTGDTKMKVQMTCGKPTSKEKSCEQNQQYTSVGKNGKIKKNKKCGKKLEVWYYNCGDNDFIYKLTFENNKLIKEDTEGRGKGKSDCQGK
ncbi:MAG: DUF2845 domain-containing protein [Syntrophaceae bacterium]|nr:DUF2845 domain-containing protein [Syntrophaceae bacterium]